MGIVGAHTDQAVQTNCGGEASHVALRCHAMITFVLKSVRTLFDLESSQVESVGAFLEVEDGQTCKLCSLE